MQIRVRRWKRKHAKRFCFVSQEWQEAADGRAALLCYLKEQVPQIFCLTESSPQEEEELMQSRLLHPLECFLFGEDPQEGLEKLKQGSSSSQLCGRVFKEGETVYSCRSEKILRIHYDGNLLAVF